VAAVLACLAEPQPPDAFRPSYCDSAHSRILLARNLRRELLLKLPRPPRAPASPEPYARGFQKPWLDLADFGFAAPVENMPHYGQQMAEKVGEASLLLLWQQYRNNLPPAPDGHRDPKAEETWR